MAEPQPLQQASQAPRRQLKPGQVLIVGKITGRRTIASDAGKLYVHLITTPARDEYSSPSTLEVTSTSSLGQKEDVVTVMCDLTGYRRTFKQTDKETGEVQNVQTADNKLRAVQEQ